MDVKRSYYMKGQLVSSIVMIMALAWLTISLPFVNESGNSLKSETEQTHQDNTNPFSNTTEERESSVSSLSEYLHDHGHDEQYSQIVIKYFKCHPSDLYYEFHPELISPPPEV